MVTAKQINDGFFDGIYQQVWKGLVVPGLTEAEANFIEDVANLKKDSKILDLMCGYGRHSLELGKKGYSVTAIDNSKGYISELKEKAEQEYLQIKAIQANILDFTSENVFDAAILMGNSFTYFDKKDCINFLKHINSYVRKGGRFIINEWMLAEMVIKTFKEKNWFSVKEYTCLTNSKYLFSPTRIETEYIVLKNDEVVEKKLAIDYIFSIEEVRQMLDSSGFQIIDMYSTPRKRKFSLGDLHIYIVAEKIS